MGSLRNDSRLRSFIEDDVLAMPLPQRLIISNKKLGLLRRILQLSVCIGVLSYIFTEKAWLVSYPPMQWVLNVAAIPPRRFREHDVPLAPHCRHPTEYSLHVLGEHIVPTYCVLFETADYGGGGYLYMPTFIRQSSNWHGTNSVCSNATRQWCTDRGATAMYNESANKCSCRWDNAALVSDTEEQEIVVSHGFQVDIATDRRTILVKERTNSPGILVGTASKMIQRPGTLLTIILGVGDAECAVGGRSRWTRQDAATGIRGLLRDWLVCGGITSLDLDPRELGSSSGPNWPKHLRTMGVGLRLTFEYQNQHDYLHEGTICFLHISHTLEWTFLPVHNYHISAPAGGGADGGWEGKEARQMLGVCITTTMTGKYRVFDMYKLLQSLINMLVLWQIPSVMTQFMAMYCFGLASELYRRARRTKFDLLSQVPISISKMMLADVCFRGMVGGRWNVSAQQLPFLSLQQLANHFFDLFRDSLLSGHISEEELTHMAMVTFQHLKTENKQGITCDDFVRACTAMDVLDVQHMTRLIGKKERSKSVLSRLADYDEATLEIDRELTETTVSAKPPATCTAEEHPPDSLRRESSNNSGMYDERLAMVSRRLEEIEQQQHKVQLTLRTQVAHDVASRAVELSGRLDMLEIAFENRLDALESLRLEQRLATMEQQSVAHAQAQPPCSPGRLMQTLNVTLNGDNGPSDSEEHSLSDAPDHRDSVVRLQQDISDLSARLKEAFRMMDARCEQLEDLMNDCGSNTSMHELVSGPGPSQQMESKQRQDAVGLIQKQKQKQKQQRQRHLEQVHDQTQEQEPQDRQTHGSGALLAGSLTASH